jgi:hypothetical protein
MWRRLLILSFLPCSVNAITVDVTKDLDWSNLSQEIRALPIFRDHDIADRAREIFFADAPLKLEYSIFAGKSSLRESIPATVKESTKTLVALTFILQGQLDAAHEVILGVDWSNLDSAEYAAMHRGQTNWTKEHPLSDEDDLAHSLIHRLEGDSEGEGGYSGWENSKYWVAGGPKMNHWLGKHPVHEALSILCERIAPSFLGMFVCSKDRNHEIIAGEGKTRLVYIQRGCFDPISFVHICQHVQRNEELISLQVAEILLLIRFELLKLCSGDLSRLLETTTSGESDSSK